MRLYFWKSGVYPLHCHYSQVYSNQEWWYLFTSNGQIHLFWKLLVLNTNTWNHKIVYKLVLNRNTMSQIDLFKNYLYYIGILDTIKPCAKKYSDKITPQKILMYNICNSLTSRLEIIPNGLTMLLKSNIFFFSFLCRFCNSSVSINDASNKKKNPIPLEKS